MGNTARHIRPEERHYTLESFGLSRSNFKEIGQKILLAYNDTTANDASMAPGMYAYLAAVREVRNVLGWKPKKESNIELAESPNEDVNILVSSGNKDIGRKDGVPSNKNRKGKQTKIIINENSRQLPLPNFFKNEKQSDKYQHVLTWFLFYHLDVNKSEMRMELSLPTEFDFQELKVTGWVQRIILDPIPFESVPHIIDDNFGPEIEFDIRRKSK